MSQWSWALLIASITFVALVIIAGYILVTTLRDSVVFRSARASVTTPNEPHEDIKIGEVMTRWFHWNDNDVVLFFLHGNCGIIDDRDYMVEYAKLAGIDLVLMDYRGYGNSNGVPSVENMRTDAALVLDRILGKYRSDNIIIMSESLGSIAACYLAAHYKVRYVVILAGISSFATLARNVNTSSVMRRIASFSLSDIDKDTNSSLLSHAKSPVLIVHSELDEIVPFECAMENSRAANAELIRIGGGHGTPIISRDVLRRIMERLELDTSDMEKYDGWRDLMSRVGNTNRFRVVDK